VTTWIGTPGATWFWSGLVWLCASALVLGLAFPWERKEETQDRARARCLRNMARDPFLFFAVAGLLFLVVQAVNGGRELVYDAGSDCWAFGAPVWPWAPSHIVTGNAWRAVAACCAFLCVCLAVRHTMGRRARLLLFHGMSLNAALLALWTLVRLALQHGLAVSGLPGFLFYRPGAAGGAHYVLMTAVAAGLALDAADRGRFTPWLVLPPVLNFLGVLMMGDAAAVLAVWVFAGAARIYGILYVWPRMSAGKILRLLFWGVVPLLCFGIYYFRFHAGNPLRQPGVWTRHGEGAAAAAWRLWSDHFWTGAGAGGFAPLAPLYGWVKAVGPDGGAGSDFVLYLCEHGVAGCGLIALALGTVILGYLRRLALLPQVPAAKPAPGRCWFFRMTPLAVLLSLSLFLVCVLGAAGRVFHTVTVALPWGILLVGMGSFLPVRRRV
ncbi:MAG: hypothetical protein GX580_11470, partial [Candidatus Hydrogenedens sp.]|nr:hypothetical protein [Candidatus Hydrogenedens sp.]